MPAPPPHPEERTAFASVHADFGGGSLLTHPLTFDGKELVLNYSTSAVGYVKVGLQDELGRPVQGLSLKECPEIYGDKIERVVRWNGNGDLGAWAGKKVRLVFEMRTMLISIRFASGNAKRGRNSSRMKFRQAACGLTGVAFVLLHTLAAPASNEPVVVGSEKQLFVGPWTEDGRDGYLVASMRNVTMRTGEAIATGEKVPLPAPGFVVRDGSLYRLYYGAPGIECDYWNQKLHCSLLRYAESDDGVHWRKPSLGLVEWEGSRDNNILFPNDDFPYAVASVGVNTVFVDPNASGPGDRLKASYKLTPPQELDPDDAMEPLPDGKGKYGFVSNDGIHWKRITGKLGTSGDGGFEPFWDGRIGKYVAYSRVKTFDDPRQVAYYHRVYGKRKMNWRARLLRMGRSVSDDFIQWSPEEIVLAPDDVDEANSIAPNRVDFYSLPVTQYTSRVYIAFVSIYSHWEARVKKDGSLSQFPGPGRHPVGYQP